MPTKQWTKRKHFFYTIIVLTLILSLVEGGFRWRFHQRFSGLHTELSIQGNTIQMDDSTLIFRNRPFYVDFTRRFQYNEASMKVEPGADRMPVKGPTDFWVLLLGGSAMEGMGSNKDGEWLDITGQSDYSWNESISYYLENILAGKIKGKKVRVFNAASSSYSIAQSFLLYKELSRTYDFDFIVSLDGQNDPPRLEEGMNTLGYMKNDWNERPTNRFPASWLLFLTQRSAAVYLLKQQYYQWRISRSISTNDADGFPRRSYWNTLPIKNFRVDSSNTSIDRAVMSYFDILRNFEQYVRSKNRPYLFLLQPHLVFRDSSKVQSRERAVLSYYSNQKNDSIVNSFLTKQRERWKQTFSANDSNFISLQIADTLSEEVFVDYCHFSPAMNKFMASFIGEKILNVVGSPSN